MGGKNGKIPVLYDLEADLKEKIVALRDLG